MKIFNRASLLIWCIAFNALASTPVEIVQSVPSGTMLQVPGLRLAKDVWPLMIDSARRSIDIAQMYISSEPTHAMEPVIQALEAAGNRGVKIRFLLWAGMKGNDPTTLERLKAIPNLTLALYDIKPMTGGILHAKYWIIDSREIFMGSQNFDWRALEEIHETGVLVKSRPLAKDLGVIFNHDWKFAQTGVFGESTLSTSARRPRDAELVSSPELLNPKGTTVALLRLKQLLASAKSSIQISLLDYSTTAYSGKKPWTEIDDALRAAATRGVKIQLLVSHWNTAKSEIKSIQSLAKVPGIEVRVSFIPALPTGHLPYARVFHSKTMIIDGSTYWVGTSNWSRGYFYGTRGIEMIFHRKDLAELGGKVYSAAWDAPYTERLDPTRKYPEPKK